jgi:hypothetical protein
MTFITNKNILGLLKNKERRFNLNFKFQSNKLNHFLLIKINLPKGTIELTKLTGL